MDINKQSTMKTHSEPATNILRFLALPFGALMIYGAAMKLTEVNMSMSLDFWGVFIAGILVAAAPFFMNKFLSAALLGAGIFTVAGLLQPTFQSWMNLVLFLLMTILYFQPYPTWLRVTFQISCLIIIGVCLHSVWNEFYKGLEHFIETDKLTDVYLKNRIKTFLPGDFSFYMAMTWLILSLRQHTVPKSGKAQHTRNYQHSKPSGHNPYSQPPRQAAPEKDSTSRKRNSRKYSASDEDLWDY